MVLLLIVCCHFLFFIFVLDHEDPKLLHWCVDMCVFTHRLDSTEMDRKLQIQPLVNLITQGVTGCKYILLMEFYFHTLMGK